MHLHYEVFKMQILVSNFLGKIFTLERLLFCTSAAGVGCCRDLELGLAVIRGTSTYHEIQKDLHSH